MKPAVGAGVVSVKPNYYTLLLLLSAQFSKDNQMSLLLKQQLELLINAQIK